MRRGIRRWWVIALFIVVVAAAATAALLLLTGKKSATVHYLTSTATMGTIAKTVQANFTLADANGGTTIALGGTSSSTSSSSGSSGSSGSSATTASATTTGSTTTFISAISNSVSSPTPTLTSTPTPTPTLTLMGFTPTAGPVGSTVTLFGTDLSGTTAVNFNGRTAFFKAESDTQVTALVPAGARSGPITITSSGSTATSAIPFTVTPTPTPTPSKSRTPSPTPSASKSGGGGGSSTGSAGSSSSSSSTVSSGISGVVTAISFPAGTTPRTLQRLLTVSGKPVFAFVSTTPLYETLSVNLSSGAQKTNVAALQRALKAGGYFSGTVDGDFGTSTQTALENWQAAQALSETGQIDITQFVWVPAGAVIESWNVALGGHVSSGTALATIDFPHALIAQALVTQADITLLKVGQRATLTIDGATNDPFTGTIVSIASQPASSSSAGGSSSTVEYAVNLAPQRLPSLAKSGMTGSLTVTIASRSNVLVVPTSAVSGTSSSAFVRVMMNGAPAYRQVSTGMATSSLTQITSGLTAGEVVVTGQYTNAAASSTSTGGGFGGFGGGGSFRRSNGSSSSGGAPPGTSGP